MNRSLFFVLFPIAIGTLFFVLPAMAQFSTGDAEALKRFREGVNELNIGNCGKAVAALKSAVARDRRFSEAYWKLSEAYVCQKNEAQRIGTLQRACHETFPYFEQTSMRLGTAYFENGMYEESFKTFEAMPATKLYAAKRLEWLERNRRAMELKARPIEFVPVNLGDSVNTDFDDYWASLTADGRTLSTTVGIMRSASDAGLGVQEDIYQSHRRADGSWTKSEPLPPSINTPGNEGAQSFSFDGRYMFFVACDRPGGMGGCDIYYTVRNGEEWSEPINPGEPLNSRWKDTTPSLAAAGDRLYFSSQRPGGKGKDDIWVSAVKMAEDGRLSFGVPVNLGDSINTKGIEISPFIHADGRTLYFASDGWWGLGGTDILKAVRRFDFAQRPESTRSVSEVEARLLSEAEAWSEPVNLGYPLNTHLDELGFVVNPSGETAYFSSDERVSRFARASTSLSNRGVKSRRKDIYEVRLCPELRPEPVMVIAGRVVDAFSDVPLRARVEIYDTEQGRRVFDSFSDEETGDYLAALPAGRPYGFMASKRGYLFYSDNVESTAPPTPQGGLGSLTNDSVTHQVPPWGDLGGASVRKDIPLQPIETGAKLVLRNVFFDVDSYELKPESRAELDRLVAFLKLNRTLKVELSGHTDLTGSYEHNVELSLNRARAVVNYLTEQRIAPARLTAAGYASDQPVATNDTAEGRALNRRTECKVVGL